VNIQCTVEVSIIPKELQNDITIPPVKELKLTFQHIMAVIQATTPVAKEISKPRSK